MATRDLAIIPTCMLIASLATACGPISSITIGGGRPGPRVAGPRHPGPPPHAPAHGYRHKYHQHDGRDVELVFDSDLGVYVVVGIPGRYFWDGYYLRLDGDEWYACVDLDGDYKRKSERSLPPGLQKKHHKSEHAHGRKSHKSHPAKGRW